MGRWTPTGIVALTFLALPFLVLVSTEIGIPGIRIAGPSSREVTTSDFSVEAERDRISSHLARVSERLRADPPSHLTPEQRAARVATLEWLYEYRANGVFPHNHVRPGARTPVFVDPHGTPCAVGYLLLRSGEDDLVEEIVRTDNVVRVPELRDDPRLQRWLDDRGITLEEAALIQPWYGDPPPDIGVQNTSAYVPATVGLSIATAALVSYSAIAGSQSGTPLVDGLLVGASLGHLYLLSDRPHDGSVATVVNVLGLVAGVGTEIVRLLTHDDSQTSATGLPGYASLGDRRPHPPRRRPHRRRPHDRQALRLRRRGSPE